MNRLNDHLEKAGPEPYYAKKDNEILKVTDDSLAVIILLMECVSHSNGIEARFYEITETDDYKNLNQVDRIKLLNHGLYTDEGVAEPVSPNRGIASVCSIATTLVKVYYLETVRAGFC